MLAPRPPTPSDAELLRRSGAGDREPFSRFVERHQGAVYRFALSLTADAPSAEDALQETFLAAWRYARDFRGDGSARSWLFTIARRWIGREGKRWRPELLDEEPLEALAQSAGWGRAIGRASDEARERFDRQRLAEALDRLTPGDRQILVLRDLEGLSNREAAEVLGVDLAAVKSRVHRARLRLAAALRAPDSRSLESRSAESHLREAP